MPPPSFVWASGLQRGKRSAATFVGEPELQSFRAPPGDSLGHRATRAGGGRGHQSPLSCGPHRGTTVTASLRGVHAHFARSRTGRLLIHPSPDGANGKSPRVFQPASAQCGREGSDHPAPEDLDQEGYRRRRGDDRRSWRRPSVRCRQSRRSGGSWPAAALSPAAAEAAGSSWKMFTPISPTTGGRRNHHHWGLADGAEVEILNILGRPFPTLPGHRCPVDAATWVASFRTEPP